MGASPHQRAHARVRHPAAATPASTRRGPSASSERSVREKAVGIVGSTVTCAFRAGSRSTETNNFAGYWRRTGATWLEGTGLPGCRRETARHCQSGHRQAERQVSARASGSGGAPLRSRLVTSCDRRAVVCRGLNQATVNVHVRLLESGATFAVAVIPAPPAAQSDNRAPAVGIA